ncbi:MAG: hypothetical protein AB1847_10910 [bacterium]
MAKQDDEKSRDNAEGKSGMDASKNKKNSTNKTAALLEYLKGLSEEKFTGYIKINFTQGCIARVEKFEEILRQVT